MKKLSIHFLIFTLLVSVIPNYSETSFAETVDSEYLEEDVVLFSEDKGNEIGLYEDVTAEVPIITIPDDTEVILVKNESGIYSLIRYTYINEQHEEIEVEGFVQSKFIVPLLEAEQFRNSRSEGIEVEQDETQDKEKSEQFVTGLTML